MSFVSTRRSRLPDRYAVQTKAAAKSVEHLQCGSAPGLKSPVSAVPGRTGVLARGLRAVSCIENQVWRGWLSCLARGVCGARSGTRSAARDASSPIRSARLASPSFLLSRQRERLLEYAHSKGLRLIGDLPFFVSPDSSDVWAHPELFLLDKARRPRVVAGVPPDYFSAEGQLWGNPIYNWDVLRKSGYQWYLARLKSLLQYCDVIRLDHFRAFSAAWHVPAGAPTAQSGKWVIGPGVREIFRVIEKELSRSAIHRRGSGIHYARCVCLAGSISSSGDARPAVCLRRSCRQSVSA